MHYFHSQRCSWGWGILLSCPGCQLRPRYLAGEQKGGLVCTLALHLRSGVILAKTSTQHCGQAVLKSSYSIKTGYNCKATVITVLTLKHHY